MRIELSPTYVSKLKALHESPGTDWITLVKAAGEDPATFFESRNWAGKDFSQSKMGSVSFKGAIIDGAIFRADDQPHLNVEEALSAEGINWIEGQFASETEVDFSTLWDTIKNAPDHETAFGALRRFVDAGKSESAAMHSAVLARAGTSDEVGRSLALMRQRSIPVNAIAATKALGLQTSFADALEVFRMVSLSGEQVDSILLNALMAQARTMSEILEARKIRDEYRWLPTTWTLNCELKTYNDFARAKDSVDHYKVKYKVLPDIVTYRILRKLSDSPAEDDWVEKNVGQNLSVLDTRTFNTNIKKCENFSEAYDLIQAMKEVNVAPDIYSYNLAIDKCATFDDAMFVLKEISEVGLRDKMDNYTLNPALRLCLTVEDVQNILCKFDDNSVLLDEYSLKYLRNSFGRLRPSPYDLVNFSVSADQVIRITILMNKNGYLPKIYFGPFVKRLAQLVPAKKLLDVCFSIAKEIGITFPFDQLGAAIATYRSRKQIDDALRIALAFPYLDAATKLFKARQIEAVSYFEEEFDRRGGEPQHASRALAFCFLVNDDLVNAKKWAKVAIAFPNLNKKVLSGLTAILDM